MLMEREKGMVDAFSVVFALWRLCLDDIALWSSLSCPRPIVHRSARETANVRHDMPTSVD